MKTKRLPILFLMTALLFVLIGFISVAATACNEEPEPVKKPEEGAETGIYYYDAEGDEYLISLNNGNQFTFLVRNSNNSGVYSLDGEELSLTFNKEEEGQISATLKNDVLTLKYDGSEMRFLKKINYTVAFESYGGSTVDSLTVVNGKTVSKPEDPTRDGYTFIGWYSDNTYAGGTVYSFGSAVTSDITLYARWVEKIAGQVEYTVDFDLGYEAESPAARQTVSARLFNVKDPEARSGYTFAGWWVSQYDDASKLSYRYSEDMVFTEDTTLYALWIEANSSSKLSAPLVQVDSAGIKWDAVSGATIYAVEITGPDGFSKVSASSAQTAYTVDFSSAPAGEYEIKVTAQNANSSQTSDVAVRYYKNKALASVSNFSVISSSTLLYGAVENAEKYLITIECGNEDHNHTLFDNGTSTYYNFADCEMREGGILFTVTAVADGYVSSTSKTFVFNRELNQITEVVIDPFSDTVIWNAVEDAAAYVVTVSNGETVLNTVTLYGITNYSLKDYANGTITVSVYPVTSGYNSPEATVATYTKSTLSAPVNIRVTGTTVTWDEVAGATSYEIQISNRIYTSTTNCYDLSDSDITWETAADYNLSVRAVGASNSQWSDSVDMRYYAMYSSLKYAENVVSWRYVIGAGFYEVKVNEGKTITVSDGANYAEVVLTKSGLNKISVRFFDEAYSDWVSIEVFAYEITFDSRSGSGVDPIYVAVGDRVVLPESTYAGYYLSGWYSTPNGAVGNGSRFTSEIFTGSGDMVLYAYWKPQTYNVIYSVGEYGIPLEGATSSTVTYLEYYKLAVPKPVNKTMGFVGWYTASDGRGVRLTDELGNSIGAWNYTNELTVYAYWAEALTYEYTSFLLNGKTYTGYAASKGAGIVSINEVEVPQTYNDGEHGDLPVVSVGGFSSSTKLTKISIPDTVVNIDTTAFASCTALQEINIIPTGENGKYSSTAQYMSVDGVVIYYTVEDDANSTINDYTGGDYQLYLYPTGRSGEYTVPDFVTSLRTSMFKSNTLLTKITIPSSVSLIPTTTFASCTKLTEVIFISDPSADTLIIETLAFQSCTSLTSVTLPAQLSEFVADAFKGCSKLQEVNIAEGSANYASEDGVVFSADKADLIYYPVAKTADNYVIPALVTTIKQYAFYDTSITAVTIHSGIKTIEAAAFYSSDLTTLTFAAPVAGAIASGITIESGTGTTSSATSMPGAFASCKSLTTVTFEEGSKILSFGDYAFYDCSALITDFVIQPTVEYIGIAAFYNCQLQKVTFAAPAAGETAAELVIANADTYTHGAFYRSTKTITALVFEDGSNVVQIGDFAFYGQSKIVGSFVIPATVKTIGIAAFYGCRFTTLTFAAPTEEGSVANGLTISDGTKTTYGAFSSNTALEKIVFEEGSNVVEIGDYAFYGCTKIASVMLPSTLSRVGNYVFQKCTGLQTLTLTGSGTDYGSSIFNGCTALNTVYIAANVTNLDTGIFNGCSNLQKVIVEDGNRSYASQDDVLYEVDEEGNPTAILFYPAGKTTAFVLPDTVTEIGAGVFKDNTNISSILIGKNVTKIGDEAFSGCTNLASVTFEPGGTDALTIGVSAFYNTKIKELVIPSRVTSIGKSAFYGLTSLIAVAFESGNPETDSLVLESGTSTATAGTAGVFAGCVNLVTVTLPAHLSRIGAYAFYKCSSLESVVIPKNVSNAAYVSGEAQDIGVGKYAFAYCTSLSLVNFEQGGTKDLSIGQYAFAYTSSLETVTFPARLAKWIDANGISVPALGGYVSSKVAYERVYYVFYSLATAPAAIKEINIEEGDTEYSSYDGVVYSADGSKLIYFPNNKTTLTISNKAQTFDDGRYYSFYFATKLTAINFQPSDNAETAVPFEFPGYTSASMGSFARCSSLQSVTLDARVTKIGDSTFYSVQTLNSVVIPADSKLETIGKCAFSMCKTLTSITLPGSLTSVGIGAFAASGLKNVIFLDGAEGTELTFTSGTAAGTATSVSTAGAFAWCTSLESVTLPSHLSVIGNYAFYKCTALSAVNLNECDNLTTIGQYAFSYCSFESLLLPVSLTSLGNYAFQYCNELTQVTLPDNLATNFSILSFANCPVLTDIAISENSDSFTSDNGVLYTKAGDRLIYYPFGKTDESYEILNTVTAIDTSAFAGNTYLKYLTVPAGVTQIATGAFYNCTSLTSVTFAPGSVLGEIGANAFAYCTSLESITIPGSVTSVGIGAFYYCTALTTVTFENGTAETLTLAAGSSYADETKAGVFAKCVSLTEVLFPTRLTAIGAYAFALTLSLDSVNINGETTRTDEFENTVSDLSGIQSIGNYAFVYSGIKSVYFGESLSSLGTYVFAYDSRLEKVEFNPDAKITYFSTSTSTAAYTFAYCSALASVILPDGLQVINGHVFHGAVSLTSIEIPSKVQKLLTGAFYNTGLVSVTIPENVTAIGNAVFYNCPDLKTVTFAENTTGTSTITFTAGSATAGTFGNCTSLTTVNLSSRAKTIIGYEFYNCTALKNIDMSVVEGTVGNYAFYGCTSLESVSLPKATAIGNYTFHSCTSLASADLPSVTTIGQYAFYGCTLLSQVSMPKVEVIGGTSKTAATTTSYTFALCEALESIALPSTLVSVNICAFYNSGLTKVTIPASVKFLGKAAFALCKSLESVVVESGSNALTITAGTSKSETGTTSLGAFGWCTALKSVTLNRVTTLSNYTFSECTALESVSLPSVTTIGTYVFYDCKSLTEVSMPKVEVIGGTSKTAATTTSYTFALCEALESIALPSSLVSVNVLAFHQSGLKELTVPNSVKYIGKSAFADCEKLEKVTFEDGTEALTITAGTSATTVSALGAFAECSALTEVTLARMTTVAAYTFYDCSSLAKVSFPASVTSIDSRAFQGTGFTEITVPGTVTSIGSDSFAYSLKLQSVTLESGVTTIGALAFEGCTALQSVSIPNTITSIGMNPLYNCRSLTTVDVDSSLALVDATEDYVAIYSSDGSVLIAYIGSGAFTVPEAVTEVGIYAFGASGVTSVTFKNENTVIDDHAFWYASSLTSIVLPANLTKIDTATFYSCTSLEEIVIPSTVQSIGSGAFAYSALKTVTIPASVTSIGTGAFYNCQSLLTVTFEEGDEELTFAAGSKETAYSTAGVFTYCTALVNIDLPDRLIVMPAYTFYGCVSVASVKVVEGITAIGGYAFYGCTSLESASLPSSLLTIDTYAFNDCTKLSDIELPSGLTGIANYAFQNCESLTSVTFPETLTALNYGSFRNTGLTSLYIGANLTGFSYYTFADCVQLETVEFDEENPATYLAFSSTIEWSYLFQNCTSLNSVTLPQNLVSITGYMFYGCTSLTSIDIPESVTKIYDYAFAYSGLSGSITIPNTVTLLDVGVFMGCEGIEEVTFEDRASSTLYLTGTANNSYLFRDCINLKSVRLPYWVSTLSIGAFYGCTSLENVDFSSATFTTIGDEAFYGCTSLTSIDLPETVTTINTYAFAESGLTSFVYDTVKTLGTYAFANSALTEFAAPSVGTISEGLLSNCTQLESIEIGRSTTVINTLAFENCTSVSSLVIPFEVLTLQADAFKGWTSSQTVSVQAWLSRPYLWSADWNANCAASVKFGV